MGTPKSLVHHLLAGAALTLAAMAPMVASAQAPLSKPGAGRKECGAAAQTQRVALLIGNGGYDGADWDGLDNAANDVERLCDVFAQAGFRVIRLVDVNAAAARRAVDEFASLSAAADTALIYYAGHGFEFGGENYLVPVDAPRFASKNGLAEHFLPLDALMGAARAQRFNLFFLDACRSFDAVVELTDLDPGGRDGTVSTIGLPRGGKGVVFYSTVKGSPALDDAPPEADAISPFAAAIAKYSATPGLELDQYLKIVARDVEERTRPVIDPAQYPVRYGQFREDFFLMPLPGSSMQNAAKPPAGTAIGGIAGAPAPTARVRTGAIRSSPGALLMMMPQTMTLLADLTLERLGTEDEPYLVADLLTRSNVPSLLAAAETNDDPVAQYLLGYMYEFGVGLPKDLVAARTWLEKSAAKGHPAGQLELGYFLRAHAPQEAARARELYELSAAQDYAKAKSHLGDLLIVEARSERDPAKIKALTDRARTLFEQAAAKGHPFAMFALGAHIGDMKTATTMLNALADKGNREGDHWLCELAYFRNALNSAEAERHCTRGASGGFAGSQFLQARRHADGLGVPRSPKEADYWARLALSHKELDPGRRAVLASIVLPDRATP
ncbi:MULTISPECIES: caspase family protein [Pseudomonadota]|jgi:TPR repeat protein|uniref:caspase family protein n=1 Tax=Pseudomonadota TaxID=1224 RepID=UPI0008248D17|nr:MULTISPECIES: caspase family protein [Pseudomonadota]